MRRFFNRKRLTLFFPTLAFIALLVAVPGGKAHASNLVASGAGNFAAFCQPAQGKGGFVLSQALFPPWYKYLDGDDGSGSCKPDFDSNEIGSTAVKIGAAVLELALHLSALVASGFFIWGSIQYVISQGDPNSLSNAKSTIANSLVGLIIVVLASGIVQFIGNSLRT